MKMEPINKIYVVTEVSDIGYEIEESEVQGVFNDIDVAHKYVESLEGFKGWRNKEKTLTESSSFPMSGGSHCYTIESFTINKGKEN